MTKVKNYLSLIKFSHTIFALPFALIGFALGVILLKIDSSNYLPKGWGYNFLNFKWGLNRAVAFLLE
ncbi:MAG: hypothetical protein IPK31_00535 [Chitinophagaceae bacterium]|nr:hypothetical protein [Chitinophagaceae bacterium]